MQVNAFLQLLLQLTHLYLSLFLQTFSPHHLFSAPECLYNQSEPECFLRRTLATCAEAACSDGVATY